jgi:hypothetical protein
VSTLTAPACPLTLLAWRLGSLTLAELWWRYLELGGNRPRAALGEYLTGTAAWSAAEHNVLVQALNECLWELGHPSLAPYRELADDRSAAAPETEGPKGLP